MLYQFGCAAAALFFMLGVIAAAFALLWRLCRPKKTEFTCAAVRFAPTEQNAAARVSFLLTASSLLLGAEDTAVLAVLAPGADKIRRELEAAFPGERRLLICEENELPEAFRRLCGEKK